MGAAETGYVAYGAVLLTFRSGLRLTCLLHRFGFGRPFFLNDILLRNVGREAVARLPGSKM